MELPPDPHNNPHLNAELQRFRSGIQPIISLGDDATLGKRRARLTDYESVKAAKIQSLAQVHARRTTTPEPIGKTTEYIEGSILRDYPGGDVRRFEPEGWVDHTLDSMGPGPYYGNAREWYYKKGGYSARYDEPPIWLPWGSTLLSGTSITRPSSADLFKGQLCFSLIKTFSKPPEFTGGARQR